MNEQVESPLRKVLDAMDRAQRRTTAVGWFVVAGTLTAFVWLTHVAQAGGSLARLVMAAVLALTCVIAWSTYAIAILVMRMSRRILRAIELAAPSERDS